MSVAIRPARADDYSTFARLFPELEVPDQVPEPPRFEAEILPTTLIAEDGPDPLGVLHYQVLKGVGYVRIIIVDPAARRRGVGRLLMNEVRGILTAAGCTEWCLNTYPHNTRAIPLYESLGLRRVHLNRVVQVDWSSLDRVVPDPAVRVRVIEPADDARVEPATNLLSGQLAEARPKENRFLYMLEDVTTNEVLGATIFDPSFPGAYPFRVMRPALAPILLSALRRHAFRDTPTVNVVCENQPAVADTLIARGAKLHMETQHMRGPLV